MQKFFKKITEVLIHNKKIGAQFHWSVFLISLIITIFGVFVLYSAESVIQENAEKALYLKQITWILIASFLSVFSFIFSYKRLNDFAEVIYFFAVFLLVLVEIYGKNICGSQRWLNVFSLTIQPSEFCKIALIISLAKIYSNNVTATGFSFSQLLKPVGLSLIPIFLILKEPDLGTAIICFLIMASISLFVKIEKKTLTKILAGGFLLSPVTWFILKDYQKQRIMSLINPESDPFGAGYHIIQSKIAVGSGMLTGKGFLKGSQKALAFLPEQHTDFIWAVIAEEFGFLGSISVLFLYMLLLFLALNIANSANDNFGKILSFGIFAMLFWQIFINIAMVLGMLPVVGVTLPLMSYGGSSIVTTIFSIGLLLNVSMRRFLET